MHSIRQVEETDKQGRGVYHVRDLMIETLDRHGLLELAAIVRSDLFPMPDDDDDGVCVA